MCVFVSPEYRYSILSPSFPIFFGWGLIAQSWSMTAAIPR